MTKNYSVGNEKLGEVVIYNRPVGMSCPSGCWFLVNGGCYADKTEKRFPDARKLGVRNYRKTVLDRLVEYANSKGLPIRIHERGDFGRDDKVDVPYVKEWLKAITQVMTDVWAYTHFISSKMLAKLPINMYASCHSAEDVEIAKRAGFKLIAYVLPDRKRKGGSPDAPKFVETPAGRALVCPEQRLGRKRVTCDKCKWCVTGKGHVAFLTH